MRAGAHSAQGHLQSRLARRLEGCTGLSKIVNCVCLVQFFVFVIVGVRTGTDGEGDKAHPGSEVLDDVGTAGAEEGFALAVVGLVVGGAGDAGEEGGQH